MSSPKVHSTHLSSRHSFSKTYNPSIKLITGYGVEGDSHAGEKVQQQDLNRKNPSSPNLRQVHLIGYELFNELAPQGYSVQPGELGENITTSGIDLLSLPVNTYLYFGDGDDLAIVKVTGLRDPGPGIEKHKQGLLSKVMYKSADGSTVRRCGIMGVVAQGGTVRSGASIRVVYPEDQYALSAV